MIQLTCQECDRAFEVWPSYAKAGRRFCSMACSRQGQTHLKGPEKPNWKGGVARTDESRLASQTSPIKLPSGKVAQRRRFTEEYLEERRWKKFQTRIEHSPEQYGGTPCWLWQGNTSQGYGSIYIRGRGSVRAHRYAYEKLVGEVPHGLELDHLCRRTECVNPAHLEPVTHAENIRRGASPTGILSQVPQDLP